MKKQNKKNAFKYASKAMIDSLIGDALLSKEEEKIADKATKIFLNKMGNERFPVLVSAATKALALAISTFDDYTKTDFAIDSALIRAHLCGHLLEITGKDYHEKITTKS